MKNNHYKQGNIMILTMMLFVVVSLSVMIGLVAPIVRGHSIASNILNAKRSYFASESSIEDVLYRLKSSKQVSTSETLSIGSIEALTTITNTSTSEKRIVSVGNSNNRERILDVTVSQGVGVSFNYGVQVGQGGMELTGSSGINGNVYANGPIIGESSSFITGSAISANSPALVANQSNGTGTPPSSIVFGNNNSTQDIAQSFQVSDSSPLNKISFYIRKNGAPSNATVTIRSDSGGSPSSSALATGVLSSSLVGVSYGWVDVTFTSNPVLSLNTTYWIVIDASTSSSKYYVIGANTNGYANGVAKIGRGSNWNAVSPSTLDTYFNIYLGGVTGLVAGSSGSQWNQFRVGTGGVGEAIAHTVNYTNATGTIFCQTGTGNNKSCDTSQADPVYQNWPVSDSNIQDWKDEAIAGGTTTGNINAGSGWQTVSMGPQKIEGDLLVGGSATLNVTGVLWITGDLTIEGAARMQLSSSYGANSGMVVVDGKVTIGGSSPVNGSGIAGSYILVVSLSDCPIDPSCGSDNAIDISGAAGAVVLVAQNGTISFSGSASAKQATGNRITLSGATTITYESGLSSLSFSSGPSGSWNVSSWKETE